MNLGVSTWFVLYKKKQTVGCCARAEYDKSCSKQKVSARRNLSLGSTFMRLQASRLQYNEAMGQGWVVPHCESNDGSNRGGVAGAIQFSRDD